MNNWADNTKNKQNKKESNLPNTTWVYIEELGWVNIAIYLGKTKKLQEELSRKLLRTG